MFLTRWLVGRPVGNREAEGNKLGVLTGLPAMGLDGLGSASYGPEAALMILAVTGASGLAAIGPITWVILVLLAILFFSYWQTIAAYPNNGGSYVVAKENLGANAGLLAASALMVDYLLNVAVGISAGVGALTSALPVLHPYTVWLCLALLAAIALINLRGTRESGLAWSLPTYVFVLSLGFTLAYGAYRTMTGDTTPVVPPPQVAGAQEGLTVWLLMRAFASGCTAMTGVEAVSNGVSAFREPKVRHAHGTLAAIVIILGLLLLGVSHVAQAYGIMAMDQSRDDYQSVLSQIVAAVYGRGWFYYVTIGSVLAVLCLSANTSFVDFPRLCHLVAESGYLPRAFALPGRRLVYSAGILFLTAGSGGLLIAFGGITDRLIPLFAVGAFLSFTLSQAGMAAHWWKLTRGKPGPEEKGARWKLAVNGVGALSTGTALAVILAAKFLEGAWITVLVIPLTIVVLRSVRRYYDEIDRQILNESERRISVVPDSPPAVIVPIKRWDRLARKAIEYGLRIGRDVTALHLTEVGGRIPRIRIRGCAANGVTSSSSRRATLDWRPRRSLFIGPSTARLSLRCCGKSRKLAGGIRRDPLQCCFPSWWRGVGGGISCMPTVSGGCGRNCCATAAMTSLSRPCPGNWNEAIQSRRSPKKSPPRRWRPRNQPDGAPHETMEHSLQFRPVRRQSDGPAWRNDSPLFGAPDAGGSSYTRSLRVRALRVDVRPRRNVQAEAKARSGRLAH